MLGMSFHHPKYLPTSYTAAAKAINATTTHVIGFANNAVVIAHKLAVKPAFAPVAVTAAAPPAAFAIALAFSAIVFPTVEMVNASSAPFIKPKNVSTDLVLPANKSKAVKAGAIVGAIVANPLIAPATITRFSNNPGQESFKPFSI